MIQLLTEGQMGEQKGAFLTPSALLPAKELLGDRGYHTNWFRAARTERGITLCILPCAKRKAGES